MKPKPTRVIGSGGEFSFRCQLILTAVGAFITWLLMIAVASLQTWNYRRLASFIAHWYGERVYYPDQQGPLTSGLAGPTPIFLYSPAALGTTPSYAVIIGLICSSLLLFAPAFWIFRKELAGLKNRTLYLWAFFLVFVMCFYLFPGLSITLQLIHADSPMLFCGAIAGALIYFNPNPSFRISVAAGIFVGLSLYGKMTSLPLMLGFPAYVLISETPRNFLRFVLGFATGILLISGLFVLGFGWEPLWVNVFYAPFRSPWVASVAEASTAVATSAGDRIKVLFSAFVELLTVYHWLAVALGACFILSWAHLPKGWTARRKYAQNERWLLWMILGLVGLLPGLMARVKGGGNLNSQNSCIYFLLIAFFLVWIQNLNAKFARALLQSTLFFFLLMSVRFAYANYWPLKDAAAPADDIAFEYLKSHPGEIYFPGLTLAHVLAEHKLYHSDYALSEVNATFYPVKQSQIAAFQPPDAKYLGYPAGQAVNRELFFPEFTRKVELSEFPGWEIYAK